MFNQKTRKYSHHHGWQRSLAKSHSFEITKGHKRGVEVVREIVEECVSQHINSLTLFAFSTENWTRPKTEISGIKNLIIEAIHEQLPELVEKVKLSFFEITANLDLTLKKNSRR